MVLSQRERQMIDKCIEREQHGYYEEEPMIKIDLIDYTGIGHNDPLYAARLLVYTKNTRLKQSSGTRISIANMPKADVAKELDYMASTIRSSWEFVDYTFEIKNVTRAFTHQFVRTRSGVSFAQQSQRSVDMSGFMTTIPKSIAADQDKLEVWADMVADINATYKNLIKAGVPAEDARGILPTNIQTNIIAKINLRALADLVGKRINPRAQGEYTEVVKLMLKEVYRVHPWAFRFLQPDRKATPAIDKILKEALGENTPFSKPEVNAALKEVDLLKGTWG